MTTNKPTTASIVQRKHDDAVENKCNAEEWVWFMKKDLKRLKNTKKTTKKITDEVIEIEEDLAHMELEVEHYVLNISMSEIIQDFLEIEGKTKGVSHWVHCTTKDIQGTILAMYAEDSQIRPFSIRNVQKFEALKSKWTTIKCDLENVRRAIAAEEVQSLSADA